MLGEPDGETWSDLRCENFLYWYQAAASKLRHATTSPTR
jgi:hypothetical protein